MKESPEMNEISSRKDYNTRILIRLPEDIIEYGNNFIKNTKLYTCITELILDSIRFTLKYSKTYKIEIDKNGNEKVIVNKESELYEFCKFILDDEINGKLYGKKKGSLVAVGINVPIGLPLPCSIPRTDLARYSLIFYLSKNVPNFQYSFFNSKEVD